MKRIQLHFGHFEEEFEIDRDGEGVSSWVEQTYMALP
jgi:hypothetical protein